MPTATSTDAARAEQDRHDDPHVKRRARLARLAAGTELFARRRGGPTSSELMVLALHSYIDHASHDAAKFAATMLGLDTDRPFQALAAHAASGAAGLAQAAGAIACGTAEVEAYHSTPPRRPRLVRPAHRSRLGTRRLDRGTTRSRCRTPARRRTVRDPEQVETRPTRCADEARRTGAGGVGPITMVLPPVGRAAPSGPVGQERRTTPGRPGVADLRRGTCAAPFGVRQAPRSSGPSPAG